MNIRLYIRFHLRGPCLRTAFANSVTSGSLNRRRIRTGNTDGRSPEVSAKDIVQLLSRLRARFLSNWKKNRIFLPTWNPSICFDKKNDWKKKRKKLKIYITLNSNELVSIRSFEFWTELRKDERSEKQHPLKISLEIPTRSFYYA